MTRSPHPDQPIAADEAESLFSELGPLRRILVAVSGGPDSMALMGLLARWQEGAGAEAQLHVATVDHGLRPQSSEEADIVAAQAARFGLRHHRLRWTGDKPGTGVQEAARHARYALLGGLAKKLNAEAVATAHTLDDQAETVLMRLLRGSGPAGLAGMARMTRRGALSHWRPLLGVPKTRLIATCDAMQLPYASDPSNADPAFTRARLRGLMVSLAAEGLSVERLARLADRQARANEALQAAAVEALGPAEAAVSGVAFRHHRLASVPREVRIRALQLAFDTARGMEAAPEACDAGFFGAGPALPLEKLESAMMRFESALIQRVGGKFTLAGWAASLRKDGALMLVKAPPRRSVHSDGLVSLGKGGDEA